MANDYSSKAEKYTSFLDELAEKASVTSVLDGANSSLVGEFVGAGTVNVAKLTIDGLADYDRSDGFASGSASVEFEPYKLRFDRGKSFEIDDMDDDETMQVMTLNMLGKFVRDKVVPEMDAVRLSTYASSAGKTITNTYTDDGEALDDLLDAEAAIEDVADLEGTVIYMTAAFKAMIKRAVPWRFGKGDQPDSRFDTFDGNRVVTVPKARFWTSVTLGTDGFKATAAGDSDQTHVTGKASTAASALNFLLVKPEAVCQVKKTEKMRYFSPDTNQAKDAHLWQYRVYHDTIVLAERKSLIVAGVAGPAA